MAFQVCRALTDFEGQQDGVCYLLFLSSRPSPLAYTKTREVREGVS